MSHRSWAIRVCLVGVVVIAVLATVDDISVYTPYIRWGWTVITGLGFCFALWNLREVILDNSALSRSSQRGILVLRLQTQSAVWDHALLCGALVADFIGGVCSLLTFPAGALLALVANAILLVSLSFSQTQRRRRLFDVLRLRRPADGGES